MEILAQNENKKFTVLTEPFTLHKCIFINLPWEALIALVRYHRTPIDNSPQINPNTPVWEDWIINHLTRSLNFRVTITQKQLMF